MIKTKTVILTLVVCLLPMIAGAILYSGLPPEIAIHWDINNEPDGFLPKALALFGTPLLFACFQVIICCSLRWKLKKAEDTPKVINVLLWMIPLLMVMAYSFMLVWGFGRTFDVGGIACIVVGLCFVLLGNYLPKIPYEGGKYVVTFPKFKSEQSFRRAIRGISIALICIGLAFFVLAFI